MRPEFPFIAMAISFGLAAILFFYTTEPKVDTIHVSLRNYLMQLITGIKTLINHRLANYIGPIIALSCIIKLYQGVVRQSIGQDFGFTGETFGYLLALVTVPAAYLTYRFDVVRRRAGNKLLLLIILAMFTAAFFSPLILKNLWVGGVVFLLITTAEKLSQPLISTLVNERIDSKHRATTLSTLSLISQIPYIVLVLFFAQLTEPGSINVLYLLYTGYMGVTLVYCFASVKAKQS